MTPDERVDRILDDFGTDCPLVNASTAIVAAIRAAESAARDAGRREERKALIADVETEAAQWRKMQIIDMDHEDIADVLEGVADAFRRRDESAPTGPGDSGGGVG